MMKHVNIRVPFRMLALLAGLLFSIGAYAQITVQGIVKDATGEPVIGASVRVVGSQIGTATDFDGNFTLGNVPADAKLLISSVGYTEQTVSAAPNLVVTLQEDQQLLDEVVVIGYGRAKKSDLTGSVTALTPDSQNHGLNTNAQDMLSGKIAGVSVTTYSGKPGANTEIKIRGGSSLNASNNPLIVIDGLLMDAYGDMQGGMNPLAMVNPNDIESFTVLKDASATAIYGSRASNGVVIITTKKGKAGADARVSYNGNVSISVKNGLLKPYKAKEFINLVTNLYGEDSDAYRSLGWYDNDGVQHFADTDWQKEIYRTAVSHDHNLSVTGGKIGGLNLPYRVSLGYTSQQGILKTSDFNRYTIGVNLSPSLLNDHLKLSINAKGMIARLHDADGGAVGNALFYDPTKPVRANNDIYNNYFGGYVQWYQNANIDGAPNWQYQSRAQTPGNPVAMLEQNNNLGKNGTFTGSIEADYRIHGFEDLTLHVTGATNLYSGRKDNTITPYSFSNNYFGWQGWNKTNNYTLQFSAYAQYMKDFTEKHHFDIMAGHEYSKYHQESDWYGYGLYADDNLYHAGQMINQPGEDVITLYKTENYLVSFFGRLNYSFDNRFLLTATIRADGSSRFAKGHKWGYFPSAALAWRLKGESFLRDVQAVNDAKIRFGWGITGQQDGIGDYTYLPTYTRNRDHAYYDLVGDGSRSRPDAYNADKTWEKTMTYNAGFDLAFLNDRIVLNFDWYYRKTTDLLNEVTVAAGSNFKNRIMANVGELHNTGVEGALTVRPIKTRDWAWEINYNITYNKNKIDDLVGDLIERGGVSGGTGTTVQAYQTGKNSSAFYVFQQVYDKNGRAIPNTYVDRNGDGVVNSDDRYFYYKAAPDVSMGLNSKLVWRHWDLGFSARVALGNYCYNNNLSNKLNSGKSGVYSTLGYISNMLPETVALGFTNPGVYAWQSDMFVENASFFKLDNITLGYSFDNLFKSRLGGRIYATAQNICTWTKYSGIDPEHTDGIDNNIYPRPFTVIVGLSLNF